MQNHEPRTGALTRAQVPVWYVDLTCPPEEKTAGNMPLVVELESPCSVERALSVVDTLVSRHEALRTTYPIGPDGLPRQQVAPPGRPVIHLEEVAFRIDCARTSSAKVDELMAEPMDLGAAWPLRVVLVVSGDEVLRLCLIVHHIAADGHALNLLRAELALLLGTSPGGSAEMGPPVGQPLDQAAEETRDPGRRRSARAMEHWRERLKTMPTTPFPYARSDDPGRHRMLTLDSPSLALALPRLAHALRVPSAAVFLAAVDLALTAYTGSRRWAWHSIFNARRDERQDGTVGNFARFALLDSEVDADASLSAHARKVWGNTLVALRHCEYSFDEVLAHRTLDALRRGAKVELETYFNFKSDVNDGEEAERRTAESLDEIGKTELTTSPGFGGAIVFAAVTLSAGAARFDFEADSSVIPEEDAEKLARLVEKVVCDAVRTGESHAADIARATARDGWPRQADWSRLGGGRWVDSALTATALRRHALVTAVRLDVEQGEAGASILHARVTHHGVLTAEGLNAHLRPDLLRPGVVTPDRYTLISADGQAELAHEEDGGDERMDALVQVLGVYSPGRDFDGSKSPLEQGCGPLLMPAVHRDLAAAGWRGLSIESLSGLSSLFQLARKMHR